MQYMEYISTDIEGVFLIKPRVFNDARGYFVETFKQEEFEANVAPVTFVQDNESMSTYGVLRGLHYQKGEWSQAKLVRVIKGRVLDVAVDMRRSSPTFGKYVAVELSAENKKQLFGYRNSYVGLIFQDYNLIEDINVYDNIKLPTRKRAFILRVFD